MYAAPRQRQERFGARCLPNKGHGSTGNDTKVALIDPPCHGGSSTLARYFDFPTCAECIVNNLDSLGIESAHYVGNPWGR